MGVIVGISGKIGNGKDAIAARLCDRWGFRNLPFSAALKDEVLLRMPKTLRFLHDQTCPCPATSECLRDLVCRRKPAGVRELLQEYGTEVRRVDDPDYWTARWREEAERWMRVAVPDVRFPNEARSVKAVGGVLWRVARPAVGESSSHLSETALDSWATWDAVILNDGTLEQLWRRVDELAERLVRSPWRCDQADGAEGF